jgi:hypothetical protein
VNPEFRLTASYATKCRVSDVEFLADCRKVLKGSGFHLCLRGRGSRKAHAGKPGAAVTRGTLYRYNYSLAGLQQSLPLKFASYVSVYVRASVGAERKWAGETWQVAQNQRAQMESRAVGMVLAVAKIYAIHGKAVKPGRVSHAEARKGGAL